MRGAGHGGRTAIARRVADVQQKLRKKPAVTFMHDNAASAYVDRVREEIDRLMPGPLADITIGIRSLCSNSSPS